MKRHLVPGVWLVAAATLWGCKQSSPTAAQPGTPAGDVVARVDDRVITVADVDRTIANQPAFVRARYSSPERRKELVENLVRFEVMAREAQQRGYERDPEVQRVVKNELISRMMRDFDARMKEQQASEAEVERYYREHADEFARKEEVRVSQVFTTDEAKARKAAAEARAAKDARAFGAVVARYSEDEDSKPRGGDLTFFARDTTLYPRPLVEAAFGLKEIGDVAGPVRSDKGWHVLKLTQRRPGFTRPLAEVKPEIQRRLFLEVRSKKVEEFVAEMRKKAKVEIYEDKLAKVAVQAGDGQGTAEKK